jgi:hypothetical protein
MPRLRRCVTVALAVLAVGSVLAPVAVTPAAASTPPKSVCPVCGPNLEYAANEAGVDATATHGTVHMHVHEDGDARFTARVEVKRADARSLRENESARRDLVRAAFENGYRVVGVDRTRDVDAAVRDGDLVVSWTVPDAAQDGPGGTLLVTLFGERDSGLVLHADQLAMYGPDGWNVTNRPKTGDVGSLATVTGGDRTADARTTDDRTSERVVWRDDADYGTRSHLETGTYVALAPSSGLVASANAELAVATEVGPRMVSDALVAGGPSAVVLAVLLGACLFVLGASARPKRDASAFAVLGVVVSVGGGLFALLEGDGPLASRNFELLALPAGVTAFGVLVARAPTVANLREAALRVAATVGVGGSVAVFLAGSFLSAIAAIVAAAVGGFYLVGVYDGRVGWPVAAVTALVLLTPVLGVLPATPVDGFGPTFVGFLLTPVALPGGLLGVVAYRVGAGNRVADERVVDARTTA